MQETEKVMFWNSF